MMLLSEIAKVVSGELRGGDVRVNSVDTDSRKIVDGQLFVAIKGDRFDGNAYAEEALAKGAAAVLISDADSDAYPAVVVNDTRKALGQLAAYWRAKMKAPVIAITGSNGKTTTKEMLVAILSAAAGDADLVHATYGNLNNDIGLPLTLLKARPEHQYIVLEMGMNHLGEIDYLTHIAKPNVAVINNAGTAHIGELGSRENIAKAKGEIYAGLSERGLAIINQDDAFAGYWASLNSDRKIITFAMREHADVMAKVSETSTGMLVGLTTPNGAIEVKLEVLGLHNVSNALAAAATATALGIGNADIAKGLASFHGVYGRLQHKAGFNGATLIDDTYNANPDSMKAALDVLKNLGGTMIFLMGDMGELGAEAAKLHAEIGAYAKKVGVQHLFAFGDMSHNAVNAFGRGGQHFNTIEMMVETLKPFMNSQVVVLVKGSRFIKMENVVALLTANHETEKNKTAEKMPCC
jgi:UDP-N-acetylmuramoyl-tripeptide--D-alanyl-D-alanine ligase